MSDDEIGKCKKIVADEMLLLDSMYTPEEFEVSSCSQDSDDFSDIQVIIRLNVQKVAVEVIFQYPPLYPLIVGPSVFVRCNGINAAQFNERLRLYLDEVCVGEPMTVCIIQWIQENLVNFVNVLENADEKDMDELAVWERRWIYSHHLYSTIKRRKIISEAKINKLCGFSIPGKPGIIIVEGIRENCQTFWETIVKYGWKKLVVRHTELFDDDKCLKLAPFKEIILPSFDGKTIKLCELKKLLTEMNLAHGFEMLLNL